MYIREIMHYCMRQCQPMILRKVAVLRENEVTVSPGQPVKLIKKRLKNGMPVARLPVEFESVVFLDFINNLPAQQPEQKRNGQQLRHKQVNQAGTVPNQVPDYERMNAEKSNK